MGFNLLTDPFLPVVLANGARCWVAFHELAREEGDEYPVEFDWPRADFNMASYEFALGVLQLALDIRKEQEWKDLWKQGAGDRGLSEKIAPFVAAFNLTGDGPLFLQDFEALEGDANPIEALLIDTPGQNGQKKNADLLTHRNRYAALGLPAAAMGLYALQAYAPSGGAGNRTSMRGGGPLTALVLPAGGAMRPVALWRKLLANLVPQRTGLKAADRAKALPWLAPTLTSDKASGNRQVHEADTVHAHPLQAYFGMPRRLRLVPSGQDGICPMTGVMGPLVTGFIQRPYGVNYGLWRHPLTPYRRQSEAGDPYTAKPKSGHFGYRDWVAATAGAREGLLAEPSSNVALARRTRAILLRTYAGGIDAQLRLGGWAMNNMEAITYLFAEQPLHLAAHEAQCVALDALAQRLASAADDVASMLRAMLKQALFGDAKVSSDAGELDLSRTRFYEATENEFHAVLDDALGAMMPEGSLPEEQTLARTWLTAMRRAALNVFDEIAPVPLEDAERARRIVGAYGQLSAILAGGGKKAGEALFEKLQLPRPERKDGKKKETAG